MADLPIPISRDEALRRLLAAVALSPSYGRLADLGRPVTGYSPDTWRAVQSGKRNLNERILREACRALGVPWEWFTVPDLGAAVASAGERGDDAPDTALPKPPRYPRPPR